MDLAIDYSLARPDLTVVRSMYVGVLRYLAPPPNPKIITTSEYDAILAAGLWVALVWESTSTRAAQGYAAGVNDAIEANNQADVLGYNGTIYYAVDFDTTTGVVTPYFQGVNSVKRRPVGVYGSYQIVEGIMSNLLASKAWQTVAWSRNQRSARANLFQRAGTTPIPNTDINEVLTSDVGQVPTPAQPPTPQPEDDEMAYVTICAADDGTGQQYVTDLKTYKTLIANEAAWNGYVFNLIAQGDKVRYNTDINNPIRVPVDCLNPLKVTAP